MEGIQAVGTVSQTRQSFLTRARFFNGGCSHQGRSKRSRTHCSQFQVVKAVSPWKGFASLSREQFSTSVGRWHLQHVASSSLLESGYFGFSGGNGKAGRQRQQLMPPRAGIHIDRRLHMEEAFRRQQLADQLAAEEEVTCPVDCVREVRTLSQFERELQEAEDLNQLVVVDFYNSACGACKYILPLFVKMCKKGCGEECQVAGHEGATVRYIKHNVRDDYDDLTDVAQFYKIRVVPMFSFFMDGCRVEQFPTRDRRRLEATLGKLLARYHEIPKL